MTTRFRQVIIALAALSLASAATADEGEKVLLRGEAFVKGPAILLGEVAEIEGTRAAELAMIEVGRAARPGSFLRVNAALILARLKDAGIATDDVHIEGARAVRARTMSLEVSRETIAEDLARFIELEMPWDPADTIVDVQSPHQDLIVQDGQLEIRWRPNPQYRYLGPGSFRGELVVDGQVRKTLICKATIESYRDVVVVVNDVPRGRPLAPADLAVEKRAVSSIRGGVFSDPADLRGYVARSTLFPGQVVSRRKVEPRRLFRRNQTVMVEARSGSLLVRNRARALMDGRAGEIVTCVNPGSKAKFQGRVRADGVVVVE